MSFSPRQDAKLHFGQLAVQYYVAGRYATIAMFMPVLGNLLHHAVEMALKAALAEKISLAEMKRIGHRLPVLWQSFKAAFPAVDDSALDGAIAELAKFEQLRYPDSTIESGRMVQVAFYRDQVGTYEPGAQSVPAYLLVLEDVDILMDVILQAGQINPLFYSGGVNEDAKRYLYSHNRHAQKW